MVDEVPEPPESSWAVAVHLSEDDRHPIGAGVVIDDRRVLTCAHVAGPRDQRRRLWVAFPMADTPVRTRTAVARVILGDPADIVDLAVLELCDAVPAGVVPANLRCPSPRDLRGDTWWAFGFPRGDLHGNTADGRVGPALGYGWVRLDTMSRYDIEKGFSGAGLWSQRYRAVVGLVGQARETGDNRGDGRAFTLSQADRELPGCGLAELARRQAAVAGADADSERGYRFRGRRAALLRIVEWLDRPTSDRRVLVVTGSPGVGKSAVLGRIVTTANAEIAGNLPADDTGVRAPVGSVACAVHVKGRTASEVATQIARATSAAMPDKVEDLVPALRAVLDGRRFVLVVDALDEATSSVEARLIVTAILLPLAQTCSDLGARVLVGSRRRDDQGVLLDAFAGGATILDLDDPRYFAAEDLVSYVRATLQLAGDERPGNPYADDLVAGPVAARIAELAAGNFLVGGLVARSHGMYDEAAVRPGDVDFVPTVRDALNRYLSRLPSTGPVPARLALTVLAYAEGSGLPLDLWRLGLAAFGSPVDDESLLAFSRSSAADFLVASDVDGTATSRLFHQALGDALLSGRRTVARTVDDHRRLVSTWLAYGNRLGWAAAPQYLLRSLGEHARRADLVDVLLTDARYLLYADLKRLLPLADLARSEAARRRAALLQLTPEAATAGPEERSAMFGVTAVLQKVDDDFPADRKPAYAAVWGWTTPRQDRTAFVGHVGPVRALSAVPVPEGTVLASAGDDRTVRLWDPVTGQADGLLTGHTAPVHAMCTVPVDGRVLLASAGVDRTVRLWEPATREAVGALDGHTATVNALCTVPVGDRIMLASGGDDGSVRLWDPVTGTTQAVLGDGAVLADGAVPIRGLCAVRSGDRMLLASAGRDGTLRLWDPATAQVVRTLATGARGVRAICAVPSDSRTLPWDSRTVPSDSRTVLATAVDETVSLCDPVGDRAGLRLDGHTEQVNALCLVPSGDRMLLASAGYDDTVRLWDLAGGRLAGVFEAQGTGVNALCVVQVGDRVLVASAGEDHMVRLWDPASGAGDGVPGPGNEMNAVCAVLVGGRTLLASGGYRDGTVRMWDPATGRSEGVIHGSADGVKALCPVPAGHRVLLACAGYDDDVHLLDPVTGRTERRLVGHTDAVRALCPVDVGDRVLLATAGYDLEVRLWEPDTGRTAMVLAGHTAAIRALCVVPVGDRVLLASAGFDRTVRLWDPLTGRCAAVLTGHTGWINALAVLPTGDRVLLASAGDDCTVRLWDPLTGHAAGLCDGHTGGVKALCTVQTDDGVQLVSAGDDRAVRLWTASGRMVRRIPVHHRVTCCAGSPLLVVGLTVGVLALRLEDVTPGSHTPGRPAPGR
ncbi:MAG TPA: trypsin-like peptidase domain-containing protein [Actinoplanes sp.]